VQYHPGYEEMHFP